MNTNRDLLTEMFEALGIRVVDNSNQTMNERLTTAQVGAVVKAIVGDKLAIDELEMKGHYAYIKAGGYDLEVKLDAPQDVCSCITPSGKGYSRTLDEGSVREGGGVLPWMWAQFTSKIKLKREAEPPVLELEVVTPEPLSTETGFEVRTMYQVVQKGAEPRKYPEAFLLYHTPEEAMARAEKLTRENAAYAATKTKTTRKKK